MLQTDSLSPMLAAVRPGAISFNPVLLGKSPDLYPMSMAGTEWLIDAEGCRAEALRDAELLRAVFGRVVAELNLRTVGEALWHKFPTPGGVTGLALLSESHLACHTFPEYNLATFNLYCCRPRPEWPWAERLREMLGAQRVTVRAVGRPLAVQHNAIASDVTPDEQLETIATSGGDV